MRIFPEVMREGFRFSRGSRRGRPLAGILLGMLLWSAGTGHLCAQVPTAGSLTIENGKLEDASGANVVLQMGGKDLKLSARASYLLHTLQDKRLNHREVRLYGSVKPDGVFEVDHFYTVHSGKLFRVRYYCDVCNIEALEPGPCVCCQKPTDLQEIPADDQK